MRRSEYALVSIFLLFFLTGCAAFSEGFKDEGLRQALDAGVDALGDRIDGLEGAVGEIPQPDPPKDNSLEYSLGALAAYVVGSLLKGGIRKYKEKKI